MLLDTYDDILNLIASGVCLLVVIRPFVKPRRASFPLFRQFLVLEDLDQYDASVPHIPPPVWKSFALVAICLIQAALSAACLAFIIATERNSGSAWLPMVITITWLIMSAQLSLIPPVTPPLGAMLFVSLNATSAALGISYYFGLDPRGFATPSPSFVFVRLLGCLAFLYLAGTYPMKSIMPSANVAGPKDIPTSMLSSPEDNVTLWSWLTFGFMAPLFRLANTKTLDDADIWDLSPYFKHANLFRKYLAVHNLNPEQSFLYFLLSSNSLDLIIAFSIKLWTSVIGFVPPYCLQQILTALESRDASQRPRAYFFALVTFLAHLSFAQLDLFEGWHSRRCYERTRGQIFCALHWKALKRKDTKGSTRGQAGDEEDAPADIGKVTNLMSGDAYAVAQRFWEFPSVFMSPIRLTIALVFLYQVLGWSCFAGVAVVLLAYVVNYPLAKWNLSITRSSWAARDKRMSAVNELFQSIRFLKYMGWESQWIEKVKRCREVELAWRVSENIVSVIISFIWTWIPSAVILVSFLSFTLLEGKALTVSKAFVAVEIFSQLQGPMTELPNQIFALLHAYISMQRITKFFAEPDVERWACSLNYEDESLTSEDVAGIGFDSASFQWHVPESNIKYPLRKELLPFELVDISIAFPPSKLTLVTGPTGSGKSSLLYALLGEMDRIAGEVHFSKRNNGVAFSGQFPFLEHATIRDNIVYGTMFEDSRYHAVLEACALLPDLQIFDAGDMTEIGEKGISLSGGQRARIALARAMYSRAHCVILDDPLAAVDMHTARHIVQSCFCGPLMCDRTIILVTHHVSLCFPIASYVVELDAGRVVRQGNARDFERDDLLPSIFATKNVDSDKIHAEPNQELIATQNEADLSSAPDEKPVSRSNPTTGTLVEEESRAEGRVSFSTYVLYFRAAGLPSWILTILLMMFIRVIAIGNQWYLAKWSEAYNPIDLRGLRLLLSTYHIILPVPTWVNLPNPNDDVVPWLLVYLAISLAGAFATLIYISVGYWASLQASRSLFISMLERVTGAPIRFFDKTPIGRILNRFVADIGALDSALNSSARSALSGTFTFLASFAVICFVVPRFAPFALVIAWLYIRLAPAYVRCSRDLRRLESISLSPAFSGFDELLHGLSHIRAFGMEAMYQARFYAKVDKFQKFDHFYWDASIWLRWRYDALGSLVVFLTSISALLSGVTEGLVAIVIIQAGIFAEASRQLVKTFAQLELDFNSIERIKEYLEIEQEGSEQRSHQPPAAWPSSSGGILVENLSVKYGPYLPEVLKGISFEIHPREKVGVVGRTGSGKSTLAMSLLRIVEPTSGRILLDSVDIASVALGDLRGKITIVSQDVALFAGTVRSNLDPFEDYSDEECWDVLERCHLTSPLNHASDIRTGVVRSLSMAVSAGGSSFSAGQRQLLALARAMLRRSQFIVLDEASSAIDLETDDKIQRTIREEMVDSLVLTIAHRLKTILDYDRILVLGDGEILEFDTPMSLLGRPDSAFSDMCRRSADWEEISELYARRQ